jgi:N4-gp56 family major capsid protein
MFKLLKALFSLLLINAFAESKVTSAGTAGEQFSDAIRLVYSKEIEFKALPNMRFFQFATFKEELGVEPGLTISMLTYDNLKMGGALTELTSMQTQALSGSSKTITVSEYGNAVSSSELLIQSSFDDIMDKTTTLLGRDYALVVDCELRDAALGNTNYIVYASAGATPVTARTGLTSASTLKVSTVKDAIEILATNNAPKYDNTSWICFVHPHQSRGLRDDSAWINASNYGAPDQLFTGEIGRIDDTRFIETTLMSNGAAAVKDPGYDATLVKGTSGNQEHVYKAVIFGEAYVGIAFSLPVEFRDNGVEDFGRKRSLAWYSIFGVGRLHNDYGVVIETT